MKADGGSAFPVYKDTHAVKAEYAYDHVGSYGMSLRDYFAAHALTGILASPGARPTRDKVAAWAYEYADAMLEARQS